MYDRCVRLASPASKGRTALHSLARPSTGHSPRHYGPEPLKPLANTYIYIYIHPLLDVACGRLLQRLTNHTSNSVQVNINIDPQAWRLKASNLRWRSKTFQVRLSNLSQAFAASAHAKVSMSRTATGKFAAAGEYHGVEEVWPVTILKGNRSNACFKFGLKTCRPSLALCSRRCRRQSTLAELPQYTRTSKPVTPELSI
jgi:hypothetical protein